MSTLINILLYLSVIFFIMSDYLLLAAAAALFFIYRVSAVWFIPLGILIDGYFGAFYHLPVFSIIALILYVLSEFIKPRILIQ